MNKLDVFKKVIVGNFNNEKQIEDKKEKGKVIHPFAEHINTICNRKIKDLPEKFKGIFVIEESYYTLKEDMPKRVMPHLFLFEETKEGEIKLISYEIPKHIKNIDFRGNNENLSMDYKELKPSEKFTPIIYEYKKDGSFYGKSLSQFNEDTTFLLEETLSIDRFKVSEILKKGDKVIIGYDTPLVYDRL